MASLALSTYRTLTDLAQPLLFFWLKLRQYRGKEDAQRLRERYGYGSRQRPDGMLVWIHAASVGEANSVLRLIQLLTQQLPAIQLLLTTGTKSSAELMKSRLPAGVLHQYAPLDTPEITARFMRHWKPQAAFFVESELWPNLIVAADSYGCFLGILNGRMSARSFASWSKKPQMIRELMRRFNVVFAGSKQDGERYRQLGAKRVLELGNLKYDAPELTCDEAELASLRAQIGARPVWLAASTHAGEEEAALKAHQLLAATRPDLLTIIVPRHAPRGGELMAQLKPHARCAQRSKKEPITHQTQIYLADTMGELGLFYRACELVFMGGSLTPHGGQNPLEPARLSCAILSGQHVHNFEGIYRDLAAQKACQMIGSKAELAAAVDGLLRDGAKRAAMGRSARNYVEDHAGSAQAHLDRLMPVLGVLAA
ncbi:MAG: 3-deoxy-D-manno-octulosonic acid transferase [Alphaproteobacteria bacterium]|nr:3-deoxy-D-manno-octulosonic acid transferase [Alphaproteobacteria bacterium]